jgi:hypothetical protein
MLLYANVSMATVYECNSTQATYWKNWKNNAALPPHPYNVIIFDDKTDDLIEADNLTAISALAATGATGTGAIEFRPLKIAAKENGPYNWLVAVPIGDYNDNGKYSFHMDTVFHLYTGDKNNGMFFSLDEKGTTSTGQCNIYKGKIPDMHKIECGGNPPVRRPGLVCPP